MDYVREELLRQRTALERLMAGGAEQPSVPEAQEDPAHRLPVRKEAAEDAPAAHRERKGQETARRFRSMEREQTGFAHSGRQFAEEMEGSFPWGERSLRPAFEPAGADVRQVSRAIERDARRYDGGFTIY